ncbi:hypothetical protein STEG23_031901 [Scotinomys teguina]
MESVSESSCGLRGSVTACNDSSPSQCGTNEFQFKDLCCQLCPSGSHLTEPCQKNHGESQCASCAHEHFMKYNNRESACSACIQCRDDQEEVSACSQKSDRKCQCKKGTYCDSGNCAEKCLQCSSCPDGRVMRQCNATADTQCDTFESKSAAFIIIIAAVIIIIAAVIIIIIRFPFKNAKIIVAGNSKWFLERTEVVTQIPKGDELLLCLAVTCPIDAE